MNTPFPRIRTVLLCLSLGACGVGAIDGTVVDADGQPIVGATVSAMPATTATTDATGNVTVESQGRICQGRTDEAGSFSLECLPSTYDVVVSAEGYTSESFQVEAPERKRYDIGRQLLVKVPSAKGLFLKQGTAYAALAPGRLQRTTERSGALLHRRFCLDADAGGPTE
ncbi:MAG: carboxypeptidase-like regulatory domain-containing protein, partial [Myxococcota bacterium]|nr:carboxypeptidase-like regulatory domain-containing protein [Myxococcota bacterium]